MFNPFEMNPDNLYKVEGEYIYFESYGDYLEYIRIIKIQKIKESINDSKRNNRR